jgi:acetoin utilization protein AcuB
MPGPYAPVMRVRDWMTTPAVTLQGSTRAVDALEVMAVKKIRRIPVLEGDVLVGIATQAELQAVLGPDEHSPRRIGTTLGDIMTRAVLTVRPDDRLENAARLMLDRGVSGLPVVEGGRVAGVITESDIFEALSRVMSRIRSLPGVEEALALGSRKGRSADRVFMRPL